MNPLTIFFSLATIAMWAYAYWTYIRDLKKGLITNPSLGFWITIWMIDIVALISSLVAKVDFLALTQILVWTFGAATIMTFVIIHNKNKLAVSLDPFERGCLIICVVGIAGWMLTSNPAISLVFQLGAMIVSGMQFWRKALRGDEGTIEFGLATTLGSLLSCGTVTEWTFSHWVNWLTPAFGFFYSGISLLTIYIGKNAPELTINDSY
jgi:hypothetical protein